MAIGADIRDFLLWWSDELVRSVAWLINRQTGQDARPEAVFHISRDGVSVASSGASPAAATSIPNIGGRSGPPAELTKRVTGTVDVIIEPGRYLERRLAPFRLPGRRARDIAMLDAASTPLDASEIVALLPLDDPKPGTRAFLVKKSVLAPALRAIDQASGRLQQLAVRVGEDLIDLDTRDIGALVRASRKWPATVLKAGALILAVTVAATIAHAHWRQRAALGELDATVEQFEAQVREVRILSDRRENRLKQIEAARQEKHGAVPVVLVWEELTRVLPDHAWVSDLTVSDNLLTFAGFSTGAAGLLPLVEASPLFERPSFSSPVVKSPASGAERFTIEAEIVR